MAWLVLIAAGFFEAVWAVALSKCEGVKKPVPVIVFTIGTLLSLGGLAWAMESIPTGTAYAVWTGIGATLTTIYSIATGQDRASVIRILLICGLIICLVGLKVVS